MKTKGISASETAYILRKNLGPIRAWSDFLSDNVRDRQDVGGFTLPPCGRVRKRCRRPVYDARDIAKFIANVKMAGLAHSNPEKIVAIDLDFDPETPWFLRIFDSEGKSITLH